MGKGFLNRFADHFDSFYHLCDHLVDRLLLFYARFYGKYTAQILEKMKTDGSPQADIDQQAKDMAKFSEMYKNPLFNALIS
ncbi:MAG: hypothetical protein IPJ13_01545 [Saprospiraceae bacterium]|nr:hypothetical protein [Saprospiraceae bacterium]